TGLGASHSPIRTPRTFPPNTPGGPGGALGFPEITVGKIGRITTAGVITNEFSVAFGLGLSGITRGPDGALWVLTANGGRVGRITTAGAYSEYAGANPSGIPYFITVGPNRTLWFTESNGGKIGRLAANVVLTATHDFNHDGFSDVLAYIPDTGQVGLSLWDGTSIIGGGIVGSAPSPWAVVGQRDFNGDGFADILWRNAAS